MWRPTFKYQTASSHLKYSKIRLKWPFSEDKISPIFIQLNSFLTMCACFRPNSSGVDVVNRFLQQYVYAAWSMDSFCSEHIPFYISFGQQHTENCQFNIENKNPTKMIQFDLPTLLRIQLLFEMSNVSTNCCNSLESEIKVELEFIFIDYK